MRKISSAILLSAFLVFISCKNNVGEAETKDDKKDSVSMFYQSLVRLGNGFIDVFNAFSGLVADAFFTADPKKSEVKTYFDSISKKLKSTKEKLESLSNKKENSNADSADAGSADAGAKDGKKGDAVTSVVQEVNKWLEEMMKAAEKAAAAGDTGNSKIGDVANGAAGTKADDASVKGIALGIKGIVDAAGKASGEDGGGALKGVKEATGNSNGDAGKLFDTQGGGGQADAADVGKASDAVSAVSGKQIIKAIVDAAGKGDGDHAGAAAGAAKNPIAAAIGQANQAGAAFNNNNNDMKKDDKIAAAIVLRGLAKGGKFAATDENGAKSAKSVIESAVQKSMAALSGIIRDSIELGLKKVSDAVQAKGKSVPGAASTQE
ncbi:variable large family protein [Borreliella burgdorferi]|uniref:variable large family protein n=1 Tax=Borreliella burgdorferi TaxID=139 RepID=UPI003AA7ABA0